MEVGVRASTFREAYIPIHNANLSIPPEQALKEGRYIWAERKIRSDATDQLVMDLAKRFWPDGTSPARREVWVSCFGCAWVFCFS